MTAAEKKARYRANRSAAQKAEELRKRQEARKNQTTEKKEAAKEKQKRAMANLRRDQTPEVREAAKEKQKRAKANLRQEQTPEARDAAKEKQKKAMANLRQEQTPEAREAAKAKQNRAKANLRQEQTPEVRDAAKEKQRKAMANLRQGQTPEVREAAKEKQKKAMENLRQNRQKVEKKEGLRTQEILKGSHPVPDLKDSSDSIGHMEIVCNNCGAFKFRKETGSTCCSNGKVYLDPLPQPPEQIRKLWHEDTPEGRLFRQHARPINNAVCLTSIKGKQKTFGGGFAPNVVYEGKVNYLVGPLQAMDGEKPCFAQLYVHDPSLETGLRLSGMTIPAGTSERQKKILQQVLVKVQDDLHKFNPFIRDFKQIAEIDDAELGQGKIIISAKARPTGEHERRYNQQVSYT